MPYDYPPTLAFKDLPLKTRERAGEDLPFSGLEKLANAISSLIETLEKNHKETKFYLEAIARKELSIEIPAPPEIQRVKVENPVKPTEVVSQSVDLSELTEQNKTIITLLKKLVEKESKVQVLGSATEVEPQKASVATRLFRQIRSRTTYREEFTYDGSGSITLKRIPIRDTEKVYVGGARQKKEGSQNYTISGRVITAVTDWPSGADISVDYEA